MHRRDKVRDYRRDLPRAEFRAYRKRAFFHRIDVVCRDRERVLLSDRGEFFIGRGRRGDGKYFRANFVDSRPFGHHRNDELERSIGGRLAAVFVACLIAYETSKLDLAWLQELACLKGNDHSQTIAILFDVLKALQRMDRSKSSGKSADRNRCRRVFPARLPWRQEYRPAVDAFECESPARFPGRGLV